MNRSAPWRAVPLRPSVADAGSAAPSSRGTHGDWSPATVSAAYATNGSATAAIAAGRRDQCLSPSGQRSGTRKRNTNAKSGRPTMTSDSVAGGMRAGNPEEPQEEQYRTGAPITVLGGGRFP